MKKYMPVYICDDCGCREITDSGKLPEHWDCKAGTDIHYCPDCKGKQAPASARYDPEVADLISAEDVAKMLHLSEAAIYAYGRKGRIPGYKKFGPKCVRFDKDRVLNWIKTQGI